ncbi:wall-associated receptor kinase-like 10 [Silene latifolia]|uniref:wall-associated receptor kinase-like 10 n=1 Tax=Silene latifolia TaxID=37657 RepID=UPI003D772E34
MASSNSIRARRLSPKTIIPGTVVKNPERKPNYVPYIVLLLCTLLPQALPGPLYETPDCYDEYQCGNVTILYPFGPSKDCAMDDDYIISCHVDNYTDTPRFLNTSSQVLEISDTQITIASRGPLVDIFNLSSKGNPWGDLSDKPYMLPGFMKESYVVLEWFVGNDSCINARKNPSAYACKEKSFCVDVDKALGVKGYRCKCINGYEGNPYNSGAAGCVDINECADFPCAGLCKNIEGGYTCHCPSGYYGDGRRDGLGCRQKSLKLVFILGNCVGFGTILSLIGGYMAYRFAIRRKEVKQKEKNFKRNGGLLLKHKMSSEERPLEQTRLFTAKELDKATDQFNEERVLGRGGQGTVYKGMLTDGNLVAIKKHQVGSHGEDFINEIAILSELNHRNIVKLIGCCLETQVPLLVYEFVPNGTLSKFLHDPQEEFPITWEMRLQIALDVAGAVTYLHSASSNPILHRDIKTSNILLDAKFRAKVSDFGTSRTISVDQTHLTTQVQGTVGYLDPEYWSSSRYTEKSDVYSFGVVLVELLTGKKAVDNGKSLVEWFVTSMENSSLSNILADRVVNEAKEETILAIAKLARKSLDKDRNQRPTMRQVSLELEAISHGGESISFLRSLEGRDSGDGGGVDETIRGLFDDAVHGLGFFQIFFTGNFELLAYSALSSIIHDDLVKIAVGFINRPNFDEYPLANSNLIDDGSKELLIVDDFSAISGISEFQFWENQDTIEGFVVNNGESSGLLMNNNDNHVTCSLISHAADLSYCHRLLRVLRNPNVFSWNVAIRGCSESLIAAKAMVLYSEMLVSDSCRPNNFTYPVLFQDARHVFDESCVRDLVTWNSLVGYVHCGKASETLELFQEMKVNGVKQDEVTVIGMVASCAQLKDLDRGLEFQQFMLGLSSFGFIFWHNCTCKVRTLSECA